MAFIQSTNQNDQDKDNEGQKGPVNVSGTSANSSGSGGQTQAAPSATPSATSSGRFQNIQNYINANKDVGGQGGMAGQAYQTLQNKEKEQENQITSAGNTYQQDVQKQAEQYDPNKVKDYTQQVLADPTKYAAQNVPDLWKQYYAGQSAVQAPQSFDATGQLNQGIQNFQDTSNLGSSEFGRKALLQQLYGKPGYSTGQQSLDQLLMQTSNPEALKRLEGAGSQYGNQLNALYGTQQANANSAVGNLNTLAGQASDYVKNALTENVSKEQQALQSRASELQNQRQSDWSRLNTDINSGQLTSDDYTKLGLSPGATLYGADLNKFLSGPGTVGVGNVSTDADSAKFQALSKLTGDTNLAQFANKSNIPLSSLYDTAGLNQAVTSGKEAYTKELQDLLSDKGYINTQINTQQYGNDPNAQISALQQRLQEAQNTPAAANEVPSIQRSIEALQSLIGKYGINHAAPSLIGGISGMSPRTRGEV